MVIWACSTEAAPESNSLISCLHKCTHVSISSPLFVPSPPRPPLPKWDLWMSKNRVVNLIYHNKPLWLVLLCRCARGPLRRAPPGTQPPATLAPPPPPAGCLNPQYFYVPWCRANFSQFLKSTLLYCEMGPQRGHKGVFWLMKCYAALQHF